MWGMSSMRRLTKGTRWQQFRKSSLFGLKQPFYDRGARVFQRQIWVRFCLTATKCQRHILDRRTMLNCNTFCKSDEFNYCSFRMEFVVLHTVKNIFPYGLLCELCSSSTALKILLCFIRPLLLQAGFCYGLMKTRWHVSVVILILIMASTFAPSGQGSSLSVLWICAWMNVRISIVLCTQ